MSFFSSCKSLKVSKFKFSNFSSHGTCRRDRPCRILSKRRVAARESRATPHPGPGTALRGLPSGRAEPRASARAVGAHTIMGGLDWLTQLKPGTMDTDMTDEAAWKARPELEAKWKARQASEKKVPVKEGRTNISVKFPPPEVMSERGVCSYLLPPLP